MATLALVCQRLQEERKEVCDKLRPSLRILAEELWTLLATRPLSEWVFSTSIRNCMVTKLDATVKVDAIVKRVLACASTGVLYDIVATELCHLFNDRFNPNMGSVAAFSDAYPAKITIKMEVQLY
jgi:hypothetical protein